MLNLPASPFSEKCWMQREGSGGEAVALAMDPAWLLFWSDLEQLGCFFIVKMFVIR